MEKLINIPKIEIFVIALAAFFVVFPFIFFGMPFEIKFEETDLVRHIQMTTTYIDSFRQGILFPDWASSENLGYGGVMTRFYPPLVHITLAAFYLMTGSNWHLFCALSFGHSQVVTELIYGRTIY